MARPLRLEFEGALYHLTGRGNARQRELSRKGVGEEMYKVKIRSHCPSRLPQYSGNMDYEQNLVAARFCLAHELRLAYL